MQQCLNLFWTGYIRRKSSFDGDVPEFELLLGLYIVSEKWDVGDLHDHTYRREAFPESLGKKVNLLQVSSTFDRLSHL